MSDEVQVEADRCTIALNRLHVKNAPTKAVCAELAARSVMATDRDTRAVILTGRGGSPCGADSAAMTDPAVTSSTPEQNIAVFHGDPRGGRVPEGRGRAGRRTGFVRPRARL
jgi:enoyl-CoA hydratase/carnithine racemase